MRLRFCVGILSLLSLFSCATTQMWERAGSTTTHGARIEGTVNGRIDVERLVIGFYTESVFLGKKRPWHVSVPLVDGVPPDPLYYGRATRGAVLGGGRGFVSDRQATRVASFIYPREWYGQAAKDLRSASYTALPSEGNRIQTLAEVINYDDLFFVPYYVPDPGSEEPLIRLYHVMLLPVEQRLGNVCLRRGTALCLTPLTFAFDVVCTPFVPLWMRCVLRRELEKRDLN